MTNNDNETAAPDAGSEAKFPPIRAVGDVFQLPDGNLQELVAVASGMGAPVTLYLPWGVAVGNLAGPAAYYEHLARCVRTASMTNPDGGEIDERWPELLDDFAAKVFDPMAARTVQERHAARYKDGFDMTRFLILRDAQCYVGLRQPLQHEYLSIQLTHVTAWSWGVPENV